MATCDCCKEKEAWFRIEKKTGKTVCNLCDECYLEAKFTSTKRENKSDE